MSSIDFEKIIDTLNKKGAMHFLDGVDKNTIEEFENANNIKLPSQYKKWLEYSDGGEFFLPFGIQLYGVSHKPIIDVNNDDRPSNNYIVIGSLSTGDPILFEKNSEQISIYNHEAGRIEEDEKYLNFFDFISDLPQILGVEESYV